MRCAVKEAAVLLGGGEEKGVMSEAREVRSMMMSIPRRRPRTIAA